jgi:hypothetical protein
MVWRWLSLMGFALLASLLSGCAAMYVDGNTKEIPVAQYKAPEPKRPVQVLFEFQTKGVANARATELLKSKVVAQIKQSGLFSELTDAPAAGGGFLSLTLNNVPLTDDAFTKGFVTGLTFGLAGSQVTDGYVCTVKYTGASGGDAVVKQARHAIHTTLGSGSAPANAVKAENGEQAVFMMTRQVISNVLHDLSQDAAFQAVAAK